MTMSRERCMRSQASDAQRPRCAASKGVSPLRGHPGSLGSASRRTPITPHRRPLTQRSPRSRFRSHGWFPFGEKCHVPSSSCFRRRNPCAINRHHPTGPPAIVLNARPSRNHQPGDDDVQQVDPTHRAVDDDDNADRPRRPVHQRAANHGQCRQHYQRRSDAPHQVGTASWSVIVRIEESFRRPEANQRAS